MKKVAVGILIPFVVKVLVDQAIQVAKKPRYRTSITGRRYVDETRGA